MDFFENYHDENPILLFLDEIEKDLDDKRYLSALHLALSIPDILGQIEYPKLRKNEPYEKWFDNYVINQTFGILYSDNCYISSELRMNGHKCYVLRCKLFHEGTNKLDFDEFVLSFGDEDYIRGNYAGSNILYDENENIVEEKEYLYVGCKELCRDIVTSAREYIKHNPNKDYPTIKMNHGGGKINGCWFVK